MNLLIVLTTYSIFGLAQIMTYIRFSIVDAYGTQDSFVLFTSLLGLVLEDNLQLIGSGVEVCLQFCMSKCPKSFSK